MIRRIVGSMLTVLVVGACTGGRRVPLNRRGRRRISSPAPPAATRVRHRRLPQRHRVRGWIALGGRSEASELPGSTRRTGPVAERVPGREGLLLDRSVRRRPGSRTARRHRLARRSGDGSPIDRSDSAPLPDDRARSGRRRGGRGRQRNRLPARTTVTFGRSCGCTASSSLAFAWGSLWVTEYGGNEIRRFDPVDGAELGAIELDVSAWILASVDDRLWVTNRDEGTVTAIAPDGAVRRRRAPGLASPFGIVALAGRLWVWTPTADACTRSTRRPPASSQPRASPPPRSPSHDGEHLWVSAATRERREDRGAGTDPCAFEGATPLLGRYACGGSASLQLRDRPRSGPAAHVADVLRRGAARRTVLRDRGRVHAPGLRIGSEGNGPPRAVPEGGPGDPLVEPRSGSRADHQTDDRRARGVRVELRTERGAELFAPPTAATSSPIRASTASSPSMSTTSSS